MLTGCSEYRPRLMELARGLAAPGERGLLMAHVEICADCARALDEQLALSAALGCLANEPLPEMAEIEARVLAEFDRTVARRRHASRWVLAAGLAAAALVGLVAVERRGPSAQPAVQVAARAVESPASVAASVPGRTVASVARVRHMVARVRNMVARVRQVTEENQPFLQIPYTVPLSPEERATVVRMEVPVAALIAAGFSIATSDPGAVVDAEVLVSQDGRARAIRFNSKEEEKQ
jgi:hypothetical protein